jgi:hypothetical protein
MRTAHAALARANSRLQVLVQEDRALAAAEAPVRTDADTSDGGGYEGSVASWGEGAEDASLLGQQDSTHSSVLAERSRRRATVEEAAREVAALQAQWDALCAAAKAATASMEAEQRRLEEAKAAAAATQGALEHMRAAARQREVALAAEQLAMLGREALALQAAERDKERLRVLAGQRAAEAARLQQDVAAEAARLQALEQQLAEGRGRVQQVECVARLIALRAC